MILKLAPEKIHPLGSTNIFLAGSIEMGKAIDWQGGIVYALRNENITIYNPRRKNWDDTLEQSIDNPQFSEQVNWELDALDFSDFILFYFEPNTLSPISLLELGLHARYGNKVIVVCPKGFWRKGNVDIVCKRYDNLQFDTLEEAIIYIKKKI